MLQKKSFKPQTKEPINTYKKKDEEHHLIQHLKSPKAKKSDDKKKSNKKLLAFTNQEIKEIENIQKILSLNTFNATVYRLLELGKEKFTL